MLFATPALTEAEAAVLERLTDLRDRMRLYLDEPRRWVGPLRRQAFARAIQGSNTIEGYTADLDDAAAVVLGEETLDADEATRLALQGYRDAMTFILQLAGDPEFTYSAQLLKSLHFMMTGHDLSRRPGRWRQGSVYVHDGETGRIVYEGTDADDVPDLLSEIVDDLNEDRDEAAVVRAGMAHLNFVMVHPFADGNGRMARCLQSLVLAREGLLSPVFVSIEEHLGRNTQSYYDVLAQVGAGRWQPGRDARPWLRYVLTAQLRQARTWHRRIKETERLWGNLERLAAERGVPERSIAGLFDAAMGYRVRNSTYRAAAHEAGDRMSEQTATRDFKVLVDRGLLVKHGQKRGTYYLAAPEIRDLRRRIVDARDPRDDSDPFAGGD